MARTDLERRKRSGLGWLWALIVIVLLVLFVWWMFFFGDEVELTDHPARPDASTQAPPAARQQTDGSTATSAAQAPAGRDGNGIIDLARINEDPDSWAGQLVSGDLRVVDVPTDRSVYVEHEGERLVAIFHPVDVDDPPPEIAEDVIIRIHNGRLARVADLQELETTAPLDPASRSLLEAQAIFLVVNPEQVKMVAEVRTGRHLPEPD